MKPENAWIDELTLFLAHNLPSVRLVADGDAVWLTRRVTDWWAVWQRVDSVDEGRRVAIRLDKM